MTSCNPIRVALAGPPANVASASYGGGAGGYVRNMQVYLGQAASAGFIYVPCFMTVRAEGDGLFAPFTRLIRDATSLLAVVRKVSIVHVLGQYRGALPREVVLLMITRFFGRPFVYEVKAGQFPSWYANANGLTCVLTRWVLRQSQLVLCEGLPVVDFLQAELRCRAHYFPNVVPASEVPAQVGTRLNGERLKLLFVGYCFAGKGVFELAQAVASAHSDGIPVELTLIGAEEGSFRSFLDRLLGEVPALAIRRLGVRPHREVIEAMAGHDVFCMPTVHLGEGHTNSVNEALMMGMVVLCTRHGFLPSILDEKTAYFVDKHAPESIAAAIRMIWRDRPEASRRARAGRTLLETRYVAEPWFRWLGAEFQQLAFPK